MIVIGFSVMTIVVVPLIDGFEEIEAVTIVDVLRRAEITVMTAGVTGRAVTGSHGIKIETDTLLTEVNLGAITAIVLPGGPGVKQLKDHEPLLQMVQTHYRSGKLTAAICAAPLVLEAAGLLTDKRVTSYPSVKDQLNCQEYLTDAVVIDGHLITSRAPATAMAFSLALVEVLQGKDKARSVAEAMLWSV